MTEDVKLQEIEGKLWYCYLIVCCDIEEKKSIEVGIHRYLYKNQRSVKQKRKAGGNVFDPERRVIS
jgi:hypothetical protein